MEYPEEIYATRNGGTLASEDMQVSGSAWGRRHAYNIGCARGYQSGYEAGKAEHTDPLEGYSNLTEAIKAGEPIDWEKLDGLKVQCVNPNLGTLRGELKRYRHHATNIPSGWWITGSDEAYVNALVAAWYGRGGWALWLEGELPLRRKTADQLDYYTYFYGHTPGEKPVMAYVGGSESGSGRRVHYAPCMATSLTRASNWVVLEEYGTSPKPEGK